jgi:hypothetical protein
VIFEPTDVALDFSAGEMVIKGRLIKAPQSRPPIQVWLWAYFINPSEDVEGSRSDEPIFVEPQFAGDTASVVARGPFHWATNQDAPRNGYYAHVRASTRSSDDARVPVPRRNYSPIGAVKVVSGR